MNNEEAIIVIERHKAHWQRLLKEKICDETEGKETIESFELGISALSVPEREKGTDTFGFRNATKEERESVDKYIKSISFPKREKGEWIYDGDCIHCSKCKSAFNNLIGFNFCPNCGTDMKD